MSNNGLPRAPCNLNATTRGSGSTSRDGGGRVLVIAEKDVGHGAGERVYVVAGPVREHDHRQPVLGVVCDGGLAAAGVPRAPVALVSVDRPADALIVDGRVATDGNGFLHTGTDL